MSAPEQEEHADGNIGDEDPGVARRRLRGRIIGVLIVAVTIMLVVLAAHKMAVNPGTEDASVGAHYIGMASEVEGRITLLHVTDNGCVQQGQLLVEIDNKQYANALEQALANQRTLEAEIVSQQRSIAAGNNQVDEARSELTNSRLDIVQSSTQIEGSSADLDNAHAALTKSTASYDLAEVTLKRNQPLHAKQYISDQDYDQLATERDSARESRNQAAAEVKQAESKLKKSQTARQQSEVDVTKSEAGLRKDIYSVPILDTLLAERPARQADVDTAKLNFDRTRLYAPFNGCVVSMNTAQGAYAKAGTPLFTLIDEDSWYVDADYRESQLEAIRPGMAADVFLMSDRHTAILGTVVSISRASQSSDSTSVGGTPGSPGSLPDVERSLNWVRLASRYAVRIRIQPRDPSLLRIGTTAEVMLRH